MPPTTPNFNRYYIYELRPEVPLPFQYVLSLTSSELDYRYRTNNLTFAPIIPAGPYADRDPYRVPLVPASAGGGVRLNRRMYVAVDALQTVNKAVFLPSHLGRITAGEERELVEKLGHWLGMSRQEVGEHRKDASADK
ncbi:hypothetical protein [Lewinella sp. IMCC34191]|uniref:hypothetical protein n=1 Tax=Lewinella sp. IMCC34191 TaxID=2259172 RepID=UPI000E23F396|nr:hypothetical protein [Lewinella sp. IMCC34191]